MYRKDYLEAAQEIICKQRQDVHGTPENCFQLIADYWSVFLTKNTGHLVNLESDDVAMMMCLFKTARWQMNKSHADNLIDNLGYAALAGELHDKDKYP